MDGRQFLAVAAEVSRGGTEAHWRTAVERSYYSVMLELRDAMTQWGLSPPPQSSVHSIVRLRLFSSADDDVKQIGMLLDDLRKFRNLADYETGLVSAYRSDLVAKKMIQVANQALVLLDAIAANAPRRAAIVAEIKKTYP